MDKMDRSSKRKKSRSNKRGGGGRKGNGIDSLALLSARVLRLLDISLLLKRHTTLASTFPLAVCKRPLRDKG